jgi:hypothetical protein
MFHDMGLAVFLGECDEAEVLVSAGPGMRRTGQTSWTGATTKLGAALLLIAAGRYAMAQQPDFRDGLYGPDDGPYEVLTFQTVDLFDAARNRRLNVKVSWPRDLRPVVGFTPPPQPPQVCTTPPVEPPPPIGLPPPPKPTIPICGPDPNYTPPPP